VFGLIPVEIDSKDSVRLKISKVMARCYLMMKALDKLTIVLLVTFLSADPNFLLYMFVLSIFMSIVVNLSGIFQNFILLFLSLTTDIFTMAIIYHFYQVFTMSVDYNSDPSIKEKLL
jgi:hypothetical protein